MCHDNVDTWHADITTCLNLMGNTLSQKGFCLAILEKLMKDCPQGSYIVMKSTPGVIVYWLVMKNKSSELTRLD